MCLYTGWVVHDLTDIFIIPEVAQEVSSNEEEYRPIKDLVPLLDSDTVDPVIGIYNRVSSVYYTHLHIQ